MSSIDAAEDGFSALVVTPDTLTGARLEADLVRAGARAVCRESSAGAAVSRWEAGTFGLVVVDLDPFEVGVTELVRHVGGSPSSRLMLLVAPEDVALAADLVTRFRNVGLLVKRAEPQAEDPRPTGLRPISDVDQNVLRMLAGGHSLRSIARSVTLSPHTVKRRIASLRAELGAADRAHLVSTAIRNGLIG
ncbi:response regulator transcription factor [Lentzea sp. NPDC058436]|uniref:helix-turn-helix transcriptional regulator n=1 Tax=Lentzea sp. NPDC058436 TaxID=3346499 RepID=UPI00364BDCE0